jgi:hypothetical protein
LSQTWTVEQPKRNAHGQTRRTGTSCEG